MDAFEKLAKLAGASVESVGDGLPRTRAEALALGVTRYFTGRPCLRGHVAERLAPTRHCLECKRNSHRKRDARKRNSRKRNVTPERKEYLLRYGAKLEVKERYRQRNLKKTGDEILFAINQAWRAATLGSVPHDIAPQCPEPQRSQLQALVDRIKADPQAGKAVIGLLRTMRELRKAELAELRSES